MAIINLRDYYPFYTSDCFMEVSEEVAEMFKEFDRKDHRKARFRYTDYSPCVRTCFLLLSFLSVAFATPYNRQRTGK